MKLISIHPGVTIDNINDNSSFDIIIPKDILVTKPPTKTELKILKEIDPAGMVIG
jgi:glutaconate CoA-transferase subunit B